MSPTYNATSHHRAGHQRRGDLQGPVGLHEIDFLCIHAKMGSHKGL